MPILSDMQSADSDGPGFVPRRETAAFATEVAAGGREVLERELPADATVELVRVRIYPGAETDVEVTPRVKTAGGNTFPLIEFAGKQFVDGDDDTFIFDVAEPVEEGGAVEVVANNTDANNPHNIRVDVELEYLGGLERVLDVVRDQLGGGR